MDKNKFWQWAAAMFWAFYIIFLLSSIPHLADWFRHLDGDMTGPADVFYWFLAYGKALAVDGADVLLTLAFLRKMSEDKNAADYVKIVFIILFIFGFTAFSWYINWQYEIQFVTSEFARADTRAIFGHNVGTSNPLVGSAFQLFALVFTFISDTILKKTEVKTAAELEQEANELEAKTKLQARIASIKRENNVNGTTALIDAGAAVFGHFKSKVRKPSPVIEETQPASLSQPSTETLATNGETLENHSTAEERHTDKLNGVLLKGEEKTPESRSQNSLLDGLKGRSTVSIEDAAKIIGCEMKYVRTLRNRGKLKATPRNNELLTVASIKSYIETRKRTNRETQPSEEPIQLLAVQ